MLIRIVIVMLTAGNVSAWDHLYRNYDALLHEYVQDGLVDYAALKERPDELLAIQEDFELLKREDWDGFSRTEKTAFWINAYNLYTVRLIIDHYPLKSIRDISAPWKKEFITLLGKRMSLDDIEHGILRREFSEPRIHFALVCAARSCPVLQDWAYTAGNLDSQLDEAGKLFLADTTRNRIRPVDGKITVSALFKWYGDDFKLNGRTYLDEISRLTGYRYDGKPKIRFMDYDWALNEYRKQ